MNRFNDNLKTIFLAFVVLFFFGCGSEENKAQKYKPSVAVASETELIVGIHPYLNAQKTFLAYEPILQYLEQNLVGVHFRLETSVDYADYERKLYQGHFDLSLPNPYQTLESQKHGYRIVGKVKPDSEFRGVIVARKDRHIRSVEQLRAQAISFPAATALAATMMPKWFLFERGLNVEKDAYPRYVGSQYSSIMNAYSGDTVAAATWPTPWRTWQEENPEKAKEMELIWVTDALVNIGVVVRTDFAETLSSQIVTLLCELDQNSKGRALLSPTGFAGFEKADDSTYARVNDFLIQYDRAIGLPK